MIPVAESLTETMALIVHPYLWLLEHRPLGLFEVVYQYFQPFMLFVQEHGRFLPYLKDDVRYWEMKRVKALIAKSGSKALSGKECQDIKERWSVFALGDQPLTLLTPDGQRYPLITHLPFLGPLVECRERMVTTLGACYVRFQGHDEELASTCLSLMEWFTSNRRWSLSGTPLDDERSVSF